MLTVVAVRRVQSITTILNHRYGNNITEQIVWNNPSTVNFSLSSSSSIVDVYGIGLLPYSFRGYNS